MHFEKFASITDLEVLFDTQLYFNAHISISVNKSKGTLSLIKRWLRKSCDPYTTRLLYIAWCEPKSDLYCKQIEYVQKYTLLCCMRCPC